MNFLKKYYFLIYPIVFVTLFFGMKFLGLESTITRAIIAAGIGIILSPRVKKIQTQSGEKKQLTWLFLKEPIILN
ncbi:hypothetical protein LPB136_10475 [Tenacibaculum todarodis]|uniref:Uncharacterized protein n=1 Tax=Tenacibaculum todarodis TaxID=1850252 RepID=A0A1L3JKZ1_9FLAO|nr:hypothetical protein [Tenacibaculum todarodis]APG65763.1 hypothetical protein LPB136_10475 [Tenacibaculum todarodis]